MNRRHLILPPALETKITTALESLGYSLQKPQALADAILRLSDLYTQNPLASTPWHESWAKAATLAYYFPLNYLRNRAAAAEAERLGFFAGIDRIFDFGSGTGSALFAFQEVVPPGTPAFVFDISDESLAMAKELRPDHLPMARFAEAKAAPGGSTCVIASYVLTELDRRPDTWLNTEALAIVEPSTGSDARRLMALRQELIDAGFHIWAPCTHQAACPLLTHSDRDWCHDRIHWTMPFWFQRIEQKLPIKNRTLTFSYLLARRSRPAPTRLASFARLTGDMRIEKGKTRQSLCRGTDREFLAWFPGRLKKAEISMERGNLVELHDLPEAPLVLKSNEVRVSDPASLRELPLDEMIS